MPDPGYQQTPRRSSAPKARGRGELDGPSKPTPHAARVPSTRTFLITPDLSPDVLEPLERFLRSWVDLHAAVNQPVNRARAHATTSAIS